MGEPRATLLLALQPPKASDIEMAITTLKEVGALTITVQGSVSRFDGDLTFVGKILEALPIDVKFGKLLVLGHAFGCLESCLVIAASLSLKSFFTSSPLDELIAYRQASGWEKGMIYDRGSEGKNREEWNVGLYGIECGVVWSGMECGVVWNGMWGWGGWNGMWGWVEWNASWMGMNAIEQSVRSYPKWGYSTHTLLY